MITTTTARKIVTEAGFDAKGWDFKAAAKAANEWITNYKLELEEGADVEEFGSLTLDGFLQQCVAENSATATDAQYYDMWNRVEANEFAGRVVWAA